jgi:putative ABC transport system permease protein
MILLVGAGWMIRGYLEERYGDPGFDSKGLLTAEVSLQGAEYFQKEGDDLGRVSPESTRYFERLLEEIRAMPGVELAGAISHFPSDITGPWRVRPVKLLGQKDVAPLPTAFYSEVDHAALQAMGVPLLQGRYISRQDTRDTSWVAVINRSFAERHFPGQNPIGQRLHVQVRAVAIGISKPEERPREIVGVVGDVKYPSIFDPSQAAMYVPQAQHEWVYPGGTYYTHLNKKLVIRSAFDDPMRLARQVREATATIDPEQVVESVMTMDSRLDELKTVKTSRFAGQLFGLFGLLALVLAMSGAYGVMSYFVAQREREFGIRMALGAERSDVIGHVFNRLLRPAFVGIMVGALGGFLFTKGLSNQFVVGEGSADLFVLAATSLVMVLVAVAAGFFPALRATRSTHRLTTADE